jgi:mycofactocin system creatininase family protein
MLVEYGRSATSWAPRLVFVNGHGGNVQAVAGATETLRSEGRDVAWCPCTVQGGDAHAGHTETSVLLHISPEHVWLDERVPGNEAPLRELMPRMRSGGIGAVSPVGVLGNPTTATAAEGARMFDEMVQGCVHRIGEWTPGGGGMLI